MAAPASLHLFPQPEKPPTRKSSLRCPRQPSAVDSPNCLIGVAMEVMTGSTPQVRPVPDHFKHSMLCEPPTSPGFEQWNAAVPRRQHARRRLSRPESLVLRSSALYGEHTAGHEDDKLSPLPTNTHFGATSPRRTQSARRLQRDAPAAIKLPPTPATPDSQFASDDDRLSPLPDMTTFISSPRAPLPYPPSLSPRPPTPPLTRSKSSAISTKSSAPASSKSCVTRVVSPGTASPAAMHSMFPQYDHAKSLEQQNYFPTPQAYAQALSSMKVSKQSSPVETPVLKRYDSGLALVDGYEHIPTADSGDIRAIWLASTGQLPAASRKVRLVLHQPNEQGVSLSIGLSEELPLFTMEKTIPQSPSQMVDRATYLTVNKHKHGQLGAPTLAAHFGLAEQPRFAAGMIQGCEITTIFPQAAAVNALEAAGNSPIAREIATFDPTAASPEAVRLAQDAVSHAHRWHSCELRRTSGEQDGRYKLVHPTLGAFAITVMKSLRSQSSRDVRAKISIHHPTATSAAVVAETLVLASLNFARDAAVIDLPSILALDGSFIIDTVISALFAAAAIENGLLKKEVITFEPPPKSPFVTDKPGRRLSRKRSQKWSRRSSRVISKAQKELVGLPADVSVPVQGAVAVIGLSLKTAIFLLEAGVGLAAKVAKGAARYATHT
ncbi:hypothetical protein BAUCODRAFT_273244 [Baudoinia panamericana UAMH 10762]|uniref:Uncharacterized protein n=1 Tax=Baudoinia panamericana (strain UAMH 10762) TaxID=717646 RepID=M2M9J4_BAUPA|nr:uncharacterized protein BAUCODRAFT_273244 [Baudoinia panamericana UAMH 10762]EMC93081.1 hypothetical protein BAUCODRAFT_273244 [Baudoinia panamericana UAMH 10762]